MKCTKKCLLAFVFTVLLIIYISSTYASTLVWEVTSFNGNEKRNGLFFLDLSTGKLQHTETDGYLIYGNSSDYLYWVDNESKNTVDLYAYDGSKNRILLDDLYLPDLYSVIAYRNEGIYYLLKAPSPYFPDSVQIRLALQKNNGDLLVYPIEDYVDRNEPSPRGVFFFGDILYDHDGIYMDVSTMLQGNYARNYPISASLWVDDNTLLFWAFDEPKSLLESFLPKKRKLLALDITKREIYEWPKEQPIKIDDNVIYYGMALDYEADRLYVVAGEETRGFGEYDGYPRGGPHESYLKLYGINLKNGHKETLWEASKYSFFRENGLILLMR